MRSSKLTTANVETVFQKCLFPKDRADFDHAIVVDGTQECFAFEVEKIQENRDQIHSMLSELPESFIEGVGEGGSFFLAGFDRYGNEWAAHHGEMEKLFALGKASGDIEVIVEDGVGGLPIFLVTMDSTEKLVGKGSHAFHELREIGA
jgi:hypothetical protein